MTIIQKYQSILIWMLVCSWMGVIFYLSQQSGSSSGDLSSGVTAMIYHLLDGIPFFQIEIDLFHAFIRKAAHFTAYFILGFLVIAALYKHKKGLFKSFITALIICVLYASTDEIHQLFIPGRSGEVRDVLIDSSGAFIGIITFFILYRVIIKMKNLIR